MGVKESSILVFNALLDVDRVLLELRELGRIGDVHVQTLAPRQGRRGELETQDGDLREQKYVGIDMELTVHSAPWARWYPERRHLRQCPARPSNVRDSHLQHRGWHTHQPFWLPQVCILGCLSAIIIDKGTSGCQCTWSGGRLEVLVIFVVL
jgi:hypothetical protein